MGPLSHQPFLCLLAWLVTVPLLVIKCSACNVLHPFFTLWPIWHDLAQACSCPSSCFPPHSSSSSTQAWLPESPRWLLLSGGSREKAEGAVRRAWGASASDGQAVRQEVSNMMRDNPAASSGMLPLLFTPLPLPLPPLPFTVLPPFYVQTPPPCLPPIPSSSPPALSSPNSPLYQFLLTEHKI